MRNEKLVTVLKERMLAAPWFSMLSERWETVLPDSEIWSDFSLARRNELTATLFKKSRRQYQKWNAVTAAVRPMVDEVLSSDSFASANLPKSHLYLVRWDVMSALQEAAYQDLVSAEVRFFGPLMDSVYFNGLAPLGWDGDYPSGGVITRVNS